VPPDDIPTDRPPRSTPRVNLLHDHLCIALAPLIFNCVFGKVKIREVTHEAFTAPGAHLPIKVHHLFQRSYWTDREVWERFRLIGLTTFPHSTGFSGRECQPLADILQT
jgi:hypothetical protein